jgi:hypothetical protein
MVRAISAYLDFCYIARKAELIECDLDDLDEALARFHKYRVVFQTSGVRAEGPEGISLPCQHAMKHYRELIEWFGSPNGLCTSITEAKHIKAVKEPWRRTNRYNALGQMLLINQRIDKMAAAESDFRARGMLKDSLTVSVARSLDWVALLSSADKHDNMHMGEPDPNEGVPLNPGVSMSDGDDGHPEDNSTLTNHVVMARRVRKYL